MPYENGPNSPGASERDRALANVALDTFQPGQDQATLASRADFLAMLGNRLSPNDQSLLQERLRSSPDLTVHYDRALQRMTSSGRPAYDVRNRQHEGTAFDRAQDALDRFLLPGDLDHPNRRAAARDLIGLDQALSPEIRARLQREFTKDEGLKALYDRERHAFVSRNSPMTGLTGIRAGRLNYQFPSELVGNSANSRNELAGVRFLYEAFRPGPGNPRSSAGVSNNPTVNAGPDRFLGPSVSGGSTGASAQPPGAARYIVEAQNDMPARAPRVAASTDPERNSPSSSGSRSTTRRPTNGYDDRSRGGRD